MTAKASSGPGSKEPTWIIYYGDGSSFSSLDGPPENAPRTNVQVVVTYSPKVGKLPWHNYEYFAWHETNWVPHDINGLHDYLAEPGPKIVIRAYFIEPQRFMEIYQKAVTDPRMPWLSKERKPEEPLHQYPPNV